MREVKLKRKHVVKSRKQNAAHSGGGSSETTKNGDTCIKGEGGKGRTEGSQHKRAEAFK